MKVLSSWLVVAAAVRKWSVPKLLVPAVKTYLPARFAQFRSEHFIDPDHHEHPQYKIKFPFIMERYYKITGLGAIFWALFHQVDVAFKSEELYEHNNLFRTLNVLDPLSKKLIRYNPLHRPWNEFYNINYRI